MYAAPAVNGADGVSVAVRDPAAYVTAAGTAAPDAVRRRTVAGPTEDARSGSLNVAVTFVPGPTPVLPPAGETAVTAGGVPSSGAKTTSAQ